MKRVKTWLSEESNRNQVRHDQLVIILNEVDTHSISVKGNGVFPVTYGLVANVSFSQLFHSILNIFSKGQHIFCMLLLITDGSNNSDIFYYLRSSLIARAAILNSCNSREVAFILNNAYFITSKFYLIQTDGN